MNDAFRIIGRVAVYTVVLALLSAAGVAFKAATNYSAEFFVGWASAFAFLALFPATRFWGQK